MLLRETPDHMAGGFCFMVLSPERRIFVSPSEALGTRTSVEAFVSTVCEFPHGISDMQTNNPPEWQNVAHIDIASVRAKFLTNFWWYDRMCHTIELSWGTDKGYFYEARS